MPFRLRLKCKIQDQEIGSVDHAFRTGNSSWTDSASDDLMWYVMLDIEVARSYKHVIFEVLLSFETNSCLPDFVIMG